MLRMTPMGLLLLRRLPQLNTSGVTSRLRVSNLTKALLLLLLYLQVSGVLCITPMGLLLLRRLVQFPVVTTDHSPAAAAAASASAAAAASASAAVVVHIHRSLGCCI
jgi:uncharacterized membrane protein YcfT